MFQVLVRVGAPVTLVAPVVVSTPLPLSEPPLMVAAPAMVMAPAPVSVPPDRVKAWLKIEVPPRARLPPEMMKFSSAVNWFAASVPVLTVMVCAPGTLMLTFWPAVGTTPVLQLVATFQSPEVPIQQLSTPHTPLSVRKKSIVL